ncbi:hypothetical protein [Flexibacter flexilis]|uniref:hypothetical protein n=1 Tax=Flexibacter flexilis TaxID=998 RepID=UPI0011602FCD|nr:hypothetical protein [Flexibacter flexilis]
MLCKACGLSNSCAHGVTNGVPSKKKSPLATSGVFLIRVWFMGTDGKNKSSYQRATACPQSQALKVKVYPCGEEPIFGQEVGEAQKRVRYQCRIWP